MLEISPDFKKGDTVTVQLISGNKLGGTLIEWSSGAIAFTHNPTNTEQDSVVVIPFTAILYVQKVRQP